MTLGCVEEHEGDCTEKVPLPVPFKPGLGSQSASGSVLVPTSCCPS